MKYACRVLVILCCSLAATCIGPIAAVCGDLNILESLGHVSGDNRAQVTVGRDGHICCMYSKWHPIHTGNPEEDVGISRVEYVELDREGVELERWEIGLRGICSATMMERNDLGFVFVGVSPTHQAQIFRVYRADGTTAHEDTLSGLTAGSYRTCLSPNGDLLLCEWGRDHLFWRVNADGKHESFGDADVRRAYDTLGSWTATNPSLVHMPTDHTILLGSYEIDQSGGYGNLVDMPNTLLLGIYDTDSNRIVKHREYDILSHRNVLLTDLGYSRWYAFTDEEGVTTIYGRYLNSDEKNKLFIMAVDTDLKPVEIPEKRIERFEDRVEYDRSQPYHEFYYFWVERRDSIWLHHIIATPEVLYRAEYRTLSE